MKSTDYKAHRYSHRQFVLKDRKKAQLYFKLLQIISDTKSYRMFGKELLRNAGKSITYFSICNANGHFSGLRSCYKIKYAAKSCNTTCTVLYLPGVHNNKNA